MLETVISDYLDSSWRPEAMRLLANLQANGYGGDAVAALQTLGLLEQQYRGTWWEQYAHMKPGMIYDVREGDPQKALVRFQETLAKFPDHKFATFCRHEIERLQKVIEQQLIQDAIQGLSLNDEDQCHRPSIIVKATPLQRDAGRLAALQR
jgi:hypothetical protein